MRQSPRWRSRWWRHLPMSDNIWSSSGENCNHFFTHIAIDSLLRQRVCAEIYSFHWYAKFVAICWLLKTPAAMLKVWTAFVKFKYAKLSHFIIDEIREIRVHFTEKFLYISLRFFLQVKEQDVYFKTAFGFVNIPFMCVICVEGDNESKVQGHRLTSRGQAWVAWRIKCK